MNIPDDVVKAADDAYWRDGRVLDEYTVIAEWARKETLKEALALAAPVTSAVGIRIRAVPDLELLLMMEAR